MSKSENQNEKRYTSALRKMEFIPTTSKMKFYLMGQINRFIIPNHVTKVTGSVQDIKEIIRPVVCLMTSALEGVMRCYVFEGQHLYNCCLRVNSEIPIIRIYSDDISEIVRWLGKVNNSSKPWGLIDYVNAFQACPGNEDYGTLLKAFNTYDLAAGIIAACYNNQHPRSQTKIIKTGRFKIVNKSKGDTILKDVSDLFTVIKGSRENRVIISFFIESYIRWRYTTDAYDHSKFIKFLEKNKETFHTLVSVPEKTDELLNKFK